MNASIRRAALAAGLALAIGGGAAHAAGFTYHGSLDDGGQPANGRYDLRVTPYASEQAAAPAAAAVTLYGVEVRDGQFSTDLDFAGNLAADGWIGVAVRRAGNGDFVDLAGRTEIAAADACWSTTGNAGTNSNSYLGTTDSNNLVLRANGSTVARFQPNGSSGISFPYATAGAYSTAIGYNAGTNYDGSLVTGGRNDSTFSTNIRDSAPNQVIFAAQNGVGINTSKAANGLPLREELTIAPSSALPASNTDLAMLTPTSGNTGYVGFEWSAVPNGYLVLNGMYGTGNGGLNYNTLLRVSYFSNGYAQFALDGNTYSGPLTVGDPGGNHGNGAYVSNGGVWTNASSRSFKDGFANVDVSAVLDKLVALPLQTWFYKGSHDEGQHMGPFAEDFASVFGLGTDDKHIATVDESGVAIAAIQGLHRKVETENASLEQQNTELRERLDRLTERLARLEAKGE